ncbi:glutamine-hydrolyzing carbamoyl-phosphate synthase small subunit [Candidatus Woesearchaeota archaeon]|nr:glutamine-hydrolyzing carbamoyl-phosphate synthase small subunit [Candidatus Woesearchaeota archaeon]
MGALKSAKLVLQDGTVFNGKSFGAEVSVPGEVVFNTGMVGYPESLTDPSYKGQILVLTYPLIGNYGVPDNRIRDENGLPINFESEKIQAEGLVVSDYSFDYSHYTAAKSLSQWLKEEGKPAIFGIDTRQLTKKLREKGVMLGKIVVDGCSDVEFEDPNLRNLTLEVSANKKVIYNSSVTFLEKRSIKKKILLIDCGVKLNIIRSLINRGCCVIRVPWDYDLLADKEIDSDGIIISNGPGDPKMCNATIKNVAAAMKEERPIFGICLGNQILALAAGGDTYKLKYGHRSQNQPCINPETKRCYITTQNHGYAVNMKTMPSGWEELFVNANDGTNEGLRHKNKPFFSSQFHGEHNPGPRDTEFLFDEFLRMLK